MKEKETSSLSIFTIASAYIGTVVGAGFASGQEILRFFSAFGLPGLWGAAISVALFFFIGYSVLLLGRHLKAHSHVDVVRFTNGRIIGSVIDIIITVFLFGALAAMIAGAGAIFKEQFNIGAVWGTLTMAVLSFLTVTTGTKGVISAISYVVPFLIVSVLFISIYSLLKNPVTEQEIAVAKGLARSAPYWPLSAANYASYNLVIAIAVLAPMGARCENRKRLFWGALLGALGLGVGIAAIYFCVLTNIAEVADMEVPMIGIAGKISSVMTFAFAIVLFAEVYTTAVGNLYGFVQRVSSKTPKTIVIAGVTAAAFSAGQLGFSNLVKYLYPAVGYGGMLFFAGVAYVWIKKRYALR
ncbi:MAG: hypothetical protein ACOX8Q_06265 [Christensenellales bacterium]|jgi:uncharacterized membrane protein YkvI